MLNYGFSAKNVIIYSQYIDLREKPMSRVKQKQMKRRSEIIETVIPLLNSIPFEELSVNDICASAGISVGSFYHYFTKKSDLLVGLLGLIDEYLECNVYDLINDEDEIANLRRFAIEWASYVDAHGLERSKLISSVEPANADMGGNKRSCVVFLEALIKRGQAKGQITREYEPTTLTELYLLALRGITTDWSRNNGQYDLVGKMSVFIGIWLKGICCSG